MSDIRTAFVDYASRWIGTWYKWGGDDPSGFDCSGFVIECLKAFGKFPRGKDATADKLLEMFDDQVVYKPEIGSLVFWVNKAGNAYHIEIASFVWEPKWFSIGAKGGGPKTLTVEDAIRQNAFIKQREFKHKDSLIWICDPFKEMP